MAYINQNGGFAAQDVVTVHFYPDASTDVLSYMDQVHAAEPNNDAWLSETGHNGPDYDDYSQSSWYYNMNSAFLQTGRPWWSHLIFFRLIDPNPQDEGYLEKIVRNDPGQSRTPAFHVYHNWVLLASNGAAGAYDTLLPEWALNPDQSIYSADGRYRLIYQSDGNLVLYDQSTGSSRWDSHTNGTSPGQVVMRNSGDLIIYDSNGNMLWDSGTSIPFSFLLVQTDGNLIIASPTGVLVATTGLPGCQYSC
jgi:hypothetical protein